MRQGIATVMMVFIVSVISIFIIGAWQTRLLLSVQRNQSLTDLITVGYRAESVIYDWVAKFIGVYPDIYPVVLNGVPCNLLNEGQPNKLCVTGNKVGDVELLDIKAARPYASTNLLLSRELATTTTPTFEKIEIIMGLDCSSSMNFLNRIQSLQAALQVFTENILASPDRNKFYLAMIPFKKSSNWAFSETVPSNNIDKFYNEIKDAAHSGTNWNNTSDSSLCLTENINICPASSCGAETNLGTSGMLAMKYFTDNPVDPAKVLRSYILFTDGLPNTAHSDSLCDTINCSKPENSGICTATAVDYLKCSIAKRDFEWKPGSFGNRPDDVEVYSVTVAEEPTNTNAKNAYIETKNVFNDTAFVKKGYENADATELATIFDGIFNEIITSAAKLKIERIVPTPE